MRDKLWVCLWGVALTLATFASGLFSWFTPLPLFYIGRKYSIRFALVGWFLVIALTFVVYAFLLKAGGQSSRLDWFSWLPAMVYLKSFGASVVIKALAVYFSFNISLSLLLTYFTQKESNVTRLVTKIALGTLIVCALTFIICIGPGNWQAFFALIHQYTLSVLDQILAFNRSAGSMSGEELLYIQQNKEIIAEGFVKVLPSLAISAFIFLIWMNVYVARRLYSVFGFFDQVQSLVLFKLSFFWVWAVIFSLALFLLNLYVLKLDLISSVLFNFLIVYATLYFFQGLAIVAYLLSLRQLAIWIRLLCYFLLIVFFQPLGILVVGLGFFDAWYDFRKFNAPKGAST